MPGEYRVVDAGCSGRVCVVIVEGGRSHVQESPDGRKIVVLRLGASCREVVHELLHAAGVGSEVDTAWLETLIAEYAALGK